MNLAFLKAGWKPLVVLVVFILQLVAAFHYYDKAADQQHRADTAEHNLKLATDTITDMQTRQREVAALDTKYTKELADAQETIDQLERDVSAGRKRLRLNATCPENGAASATSVDDGTGPRLAYAAERDYFLLRQRSQTITTQLKGLQEYVKTQCN
ncbi:lysis protein [Enterobacter sp. ENT03]|uniref:lysis protein n=1 Tax=Enterobacter sp. ENT03 TaxID=2854780 RepID=UPI001C45AE60|nr:lysis protein [Enterobacter sp. ENT03]MBV7404524.1 lysis protein [Enterobacter sp. ENT03]